MKKWKNDVEKEKQRTGKSPAPGASNATVKTQRALTFLFVCRSCTDTIGPIYRSCLPKAIDSFCDTNPYTPVKSTASSKTDLRTAKSDGVKIDLVDVTRQKCAELIYDALASDSGSRTYLPILP